MNALELADEWDKYCGETLEWNGKSSKVLSTMLRQQKVDLKIADDAHDILTRTVKEQQIRIDQLLETQDYLYKRYDEQQLEIEELKDDVKWLYDINVQRYPELKDGQLPVLYVTLNHNGKQIKGIVSLKETRIICDSVKDRLKEISYERK